MTPGAAAAGPAREARVFASTAIFVKDNLLPVNALIAGSLFTVAAIDFARPIAPPYLPALLYSATAIAAAALFAAGVLPVRALRASSRAGADQRPLRRRPWWVFAVSLLALISGLGWASHAAAGERGLIAGSWGGAAGLQAALLRLQAGSDAANSKLDTVLARQADPGPTAMGDACPDIQCALGLGASEAALRRHLARGAQLPTEPSFVSSMIDRQARFRFPARMAAIGLYLDNGALPSIDGRYTTPLFTDPAELRAIEETLPPAIAGKAREMFRGPTPCQRPKLRMAEVAALHGDKELFDFLVARGADPNLANQWCEGGRNPAPFNASRLLRARG